MRSALVPLLAMALAGPVLAAPAPLAPGAGHAEESLCVVGRASGQAETRGRAPRSPAQEARDLDAIAEALLLCPSADEKVRAGAPRVPLAQPQTAGARVSADSEGQA